MLQESEGVSWICTAGVGESPNVATMGAQWPMKVEPKEVAAAARKPRNGLIDNDVSFAQTLKGATIGLQHVFALF